MSLLCFPDKTNVSTAIILRSIFQFMSVTFKLVNNDIVRIFSREKPYCCVTEHKSILKTYIFEYLIIYAT